MNLDYLIQILQNKIMILNNAKNMAFANGDMDTMNSIDKQLFENQTTLSQLQLLLAATQAMNATSGDLSSIVTAGIAAAQSTANIPSDPSMVINGYDMTLYAADPLYEDKLRDMLSTMPVMDTATAIDSYIAQEVVGSPLTSAMIQTAASTYGVDTRLLMAIMELDSRFGTAGVGAKTNNPGNVGNTGSSTQTYASWDDGVAAVASWLNNHRAVVAPVMVAPAPVVVAPVVPPPPVVDTPAPTPVATVGTPPDASSIPPAASTTTDISVPDTSASTTPAIVSDTSASTTPDVSAPDASSTPAS